MTNAATRASLVGLLLILAVPIEAGWPHVGGDTNGSNHFELAGAISSASEERPGVVASVDLLEPDFVPSLLLDVNGDGSREVLLPHQDRLAAFDSETGVLVWATPSLGITHVLGPFDALGTGSEDHLIATSDAMGGGVHLIEVTVGAVVWSFTGLGSASGVNPRELAVADMDGDGAVEMVFAPSLHGNPDLHVVDWSTGGSVALATTQTQGTDKQVSRLAIGDYDGDGLSDEVVLYQRSELDFKELCSVGDAGAQCDPTDTVCICDAALVQAYDLGAYPQPVTLDVNDAGADEVLAVHQHSRWESGFGVLDAATAFAGSPSPASLGRWYYDYGPDGLDARPILVEETAVDLDGDGALEVLVDLRDPSTSETDWNGNAADDGLDNVGGYGFGIYDADDGTPLATVDDRYAMGVVDLDQDGALEVVTSTTTGYDFSTGDVEGWEFSCTAPQTCSLALAWSAPFRLLQEPVRHAGGAFPAPDLKVVEVDGSPAILVWDGAADLVSVAWDGTQIVELGRVTFLPNEELSLADGDLVLHLGANGSVMPRAGDLSLLGEAYQVPGRTAGAWIVPTFLDLGRDVAILDGNVFLTSQTPSSVLDADLRIGDVVLLAEDLDADGRTDLIAWTDDDGINGFQLSRWEEDGAGGLTQLWNFDADSVAGLDDVFFRAYWQAVAYDWSGDGTKEIVIAPRDPTDGRMLGFDGAAGSLEWDTLAVEDDSFFAPLALVDVVDNGTYGSGDGVMDIVRVTSRRIHVWEWKGTSLAGNRLTTDFNSQAAVADVDGDTEPEVVTLLSSSINRTQIEVWDLLPNAPLLWGPVTDLGAPTGAEQSMSLVQADGGSGLDVAVISSEGSVELFDGATGTRLTGFPVYLGAGATSSAPLAQRDPLTAIVAGDVDGDGEDEVIVGARSGWLYGLNVSQAEGTPNIEWTMELGAPIVNLAAGDVDGDGASELFVSIQDGQQRIIDGIGFDVEVLVPAENACITGTTIEVSGTSQLVDEVAVFVQGVEQAVVTVDGDGDWSTTVPFPLVSGLVQLVAEGRVGGLEVGSDSVTLLSDGEGDLDGDGWTVCGGDCNENDPNIFPGAEEVCDGLDNDCDPETLENVDADGDGVGVCDDPIDCDDSEATVFPADAEELCDDGLDNDCDGSVDGDDGDCVEGDDDDSATTDPDGCAGCDCESSVAGQPGGRVAFLLFGLLLAARRRRYGFVLSQSTSR